MLQKKRKFDIYASILEPAKSIFCLLVHWQCSSCWVKACARSCLLVFFYEIPGLIKLGRGVNPHPVVIVGGFERKESQKDFPDFLEKLPVMILTNAGK